MWINENTGAVFSAHHEIRAAASDMSLPSVLDDALLASLGFALVAQAAQPEFDVATQKVEPAAPEKVGGSWTQTWAVRDLTAAELRARVPQEITVKQARLALLSAGLLDDVEAAVQKAGREARIEWDFASVYQRDNPVLLGMQAALGMTNEQLDELFALGATL